MLNILRSLALAATLVAAPALAHSPNQPPHQVHKIGDLQLESGETIKDFAISYVTHGKLNEKKSNAILMVTAISGNHHRLDFLIGPGKALDTDKYFIICTDAIGNGLTTSPSNSAAQPRMKFPKFLIRDMVTSQKKLMEHLGIGRVVAVIGPSMGGMQVLQWGVSHPDFMDSLVSLVPLAEHRPGPSRCWKRPARRSCSIRRGRTATTPSRPSRESGCGATSSTSLPRARRKSRATSFPTRWTSCRSCRRRRPR
jgi:homoserine O-acetyltransferase